MKIESFYTLHSTAASLVVDCRSNVPAILYWGSRLLEHTTPDMLATLATRQEAPASAASEAAIALTPELGAGFQADPGLRVHRDGRAWGVFATIEAVEVDGGSLTIRSRCESSQLTLVHRLELDAESGVLVLSTTITNNGSDVLTIDRCDAPAIPLPAELSHITSFSGRWANEFQTQTIEPFYGSYVRENLAGRTSHDTFPGLVVHTDGFKEHSGEGYALTLGWSGNHRVSVTRMICGRAVAQLGEAFYPGELRLESGEQYTTPKLFAATSNGGMTPLSQSLHRYVRSHLTDARMHGKLKPVHFNTWEAMYFDLDMDRLRALADAAADVGAERFVLDDGWFPRRNNDDAGLGDWTVDPNKFPDGLQPLIDHVHRCGMEFGLWIEPEMVNPDSDLYRSHPGWALQVDGAPLRMARNQLVLDLSRPEVSDYLFCCIDALLTEYPITYLKWDMNRDLHQPGNHLGHAVTHRQVRAVYALMQRVRQAHTQVEIESCASGGARADYGVLANTDRIWTSDSNDALDRLRIQRGFSMFFPPELMGSHVGPRECHITGRTLSMPLRAGVALMGDMGIEADVTDMPHAERTELAAAIALHKQHRALLFSGDVVRLDPTRYEMAHGVVSQDQDQALFSYAIIATPPHNLPSRLRFAGLEPTNQYRIEVVWPESPWRYSPSILEVIGSGAYTGQALMQAGLQMPLLKPESLLLLHLTRA